eukprot:CAMPEP_0201247082 /NCGR_PEP_ID=MMETSP0852-20130820/52890_1 /ASSEMBLY_ACC=CAM_ASM_000632 /TAXON_ID=183588 /ORGANISM="Pseudo-nitzschia fraudulenta, Strain WWA7" /LENGTH=412 /DNA_ID=CAMNT_0047545433 /DNA_START=12 /DNA_END=1250 /DNA_ORIENTATION=-
MAIGRYTRIGRTNNIHSASQSLLVLFVILSFSNLSSSFSFFARDIRKNNNPCTTRSKTDASPPVQLPTQATSPRFLRPFAPGFLSMAEECDRTAEADAIGSSSSAGDSDGDANTHTIHFRVATPDDIPRCFDIETASYPSDEAATMESLMNRQKHAGDYFLLCTTTAGDDGGETVLGFVCATRCHEFTEESMSSLHFPDGKLLAIHSIAVDEKHRRRGIATRLLNRYVRDVLEQEEERQGSQAESNDPIESIVLIAKQHLLGFYVRCGFRVNRPSPIVHGKELWYDLEMEVPRGAKKKNQATVRKDPLPGESWFCKTERFKTSLAFPEIKPHLDAHTEWVKSVRDAGEVCIVSGYRVDAEGRPGGGGLMFLAAKSYEEAYDLVSQYDPLIVNGCVDWELNGWIGQVGDIKVD